MTILLTHHENQIEVALGWLESQMRETESADSPAFVTYEVLTRHLVYKDENETYEKLRAEYEVLRARVKNLEDSLADVK